MTDLCGTFRQQAGRVWRQMLESSRLGLGLSEETITETCLYNIARRHQSGDIAIIPATKPQEAKHGGDWKWWFTKGGKGVGFRIQAKRLFPSGNYENLFKKGPNPLEQLNKLRSAAKADNLVPLYCFYNFGHKAGSFHGHGNPCHHSYRGPSFWGCSIMLPEDVAFAGSHEIKRLQPAMEPWHVLACDMQNSNLPKAAAAFVRKLAAAKGHLGTEGAPRTRPALSIEVDMRSVPAYVARLVEVGRSRREAAADGQAYLDQEYWQEAVLSEREDIAGIVAFDDTRNTQE